MRIRQRGIAIVLALSVVALAAMAAAAIMVSQSTWARQVELTTDHIQARSVLLAGADWGRAILYADSQNDETLLNQHRIDIVVDHLGEPWALKLPPMPVENGELLGQIEDQQGKFNVNNLLTTNGTGPGQIGVNTAQLRHFKTLLGLLGLPAELGDALADWISKPPTQEGAADKYYLALDPPYLAANQPLLDIDELALVRGFDDNVRARLRPYITALPGFTTVNVNTAPAEVIAAVIDNLDLGAAQNLVAQRERAYFSKPEDFLDRLLLNVKAGADATTISVSSDYFMATLRVTIGGAQARGKALFSRLDSKSKRWPAIVWRKYL